MGRVRSPGYDTDHLGTIRGTSLRRTPPCGQRGLRQGHPDGADGRDPGADRAAGGAHRPRRRRVRGPGRPARRHADGDPHVDVQQQPRHHADGGVVRHARLLRLHDPGFVARAPRDVLRAPDRGGPRRADAPLLDHEHGRRGVGELHARRRHSVRLLLALLLGLACSREVHAQLGEVQSLIERGRYADALRLATAADRRAKASGDLALEAHVELARGTIWQARGFPRPAVQHFEHALDAARRADQRALVAAAYGSLASAHGDLGHWDRVLDFAERRHEAEPRQTSDSEFRYRFQRGVAYAEFHDRERAEANLVEALSIARKANDRRSTSMALGELASAIADFQHDPPRALSLYDEALGIAKDAGVRDLEATWLLDSGAALREAGRYAEAGARFTRAIDAERASGARRVTPAAQKNLAQVFLHDDDRRAAAATLAAAERGADDQNLGELRWQVRVERAVMARDDGRAAEAERLFDEALDILEDAQGSVLVEQLRSGALQHALASADPYDLFIAFLLSHGNASKAFFVAERGRARAFLDTLRTSGDQIAQALPPEYAEAEATLLADISEGQAALRGERLPVADRRSLQAAIRSDEEQLAALRLRLASDRPAVSAVRYPRLWQAGDLGATVLKPNQALIAFFLGATTSNAWIVHKQGTQVVTLPAQAIVEAAVRTYLKSVGRAAGAGEADGAAKLYRLLLQDA